MVYTNRADQVPDVDVPIECAEYYQRFWSIRALVGDPDAPVTFAVIEDWQRHTYNTMQKFERDFIFGMDRAFRHARIEVLKFHSKRPKVKTEDNDRKRLG